MTLPVRSRLACCCCCLLVQASVVSAAAIVVNEVADKGTSGQCNGGDWVELYNSGAAEQSIASYVLHDDKGPSDKGAHTFPAGTKIAAGGYIVVCRVKCSRGVRNGVCQDEDFNGMIFTVGGDDTISLLDDKGSLLSTSGTLLDQGSSLTTWSRTSAGKYQYTTTPTPGKANIFT